MVDSSVVLRATSSFSKWRSRMATTCHIPDGFLVQAETTIFTIYPITTTAITVPIIMYFVRLSISHVVLGSPPPKLEVATMNHMRRCLNIR